MLGGHSTEIYIYRFSSQGGQEDRLYLHEVDGMGGHANSDV